LILLVAVGLFVPVMALWLWKATGLDTVAEAAAPPLGVPMVGRGLRPRRGPRRRDEGRL